MSKYFGTPFAESGTKTAIPDAAQAGGEVSYAEGYTNDYTLDQTSNPSAKDIEIDKFNQLGNDLSGAIKDIQEQGIPVYRADVNHTVNSRKVGSDGEVYKCLIANGPLTTVVDPVGDVTGTWFFADQNEISVTGTATFTNSTNNIALTGVGLLDGLEVGDVYEVSGTSNNDGLFTVEVITDNDNVVFNLAHAGGSTTKSFTDETSSCTLTLISKWYSAPIGLGQGWVNLLSARSSFVTYTNSTGRAIPVNVANFVTTITDTGKVDGISVTYTENINQAESSSFIVPAGSNYVVDGGTMLMWSEMR